MPRWCGGLATRELVVVARIAAGAGDFRSPQADRVFAHRLGDDARDDIERSAPQETARSA